MKFLNHSTFKIVLRIAVGLVFITSALTKLYPIIPLEILLVKTGITNWSLAPIFARLLIGFEFLLGSFLIFNIQTKKTTIVSMLSLVGFTFYLLYLNFFVSADDNCGCFGEIIKLNPLQSILKNIVLFALLVLLFKTHSTSNNFRFKTALLIFITASSLALPFIFNLMKTHGSKGNYIVKPYTFVENEQLKSLPFSNGKNVNLLEDKKIICFLSLHCEACKYAASKFSVLYKENNKIPVHIIFLDTKNRTEYLKKFEKETSIKNIPYTFLPYEDFFKASSGSLPFIMFLENGEIKHLTNFDDLFVQDVLDFSNSTNK